MEIQPASQPESNPVETIQTRSNPSFYSARSIFYLFSAIMLPIHFWTTIMAFRDVEWVIVRSTSWDAIGLISYSQVFAFVESAAIFAGLMVLGFLLPRRWTPERRAAALASIFSALLFIALLNQFYFISGSNLPTGMMAFLIHSGHPVFIFRLVIILFVIVLVCIPITLFLWKSTIERPALSLLQKIVPLSIFYLILDAIALILLVIRNVHES